VKARNAFERQNVRRRHRHDRVAARMKETERVLRRHRHFFGAMLGVLDRDLP
jgi:hypothetical protein